LFYSICGVVPPVNNVGYHETNDATLFPDCWGGIQRAHALFKGLKRPMIDNGLDRDVFIYVCKPPYRYTYLPHMVCVAKREDVPQNQLLTILVVREADGFEISDWNWVLSDSADDTLPKGYTERYETRIW
jgi:hypothetical protein